jgi:hypothetical protein
LTTKKTQAHCIKFGSTGDAITFPFCSSFRALAKLQSHKPKKTNLAMKLVATCSAKRKLERMFCTTALTSRYGRDESRVRFLMQNVDASELLFHFVVPIDGSSRPGPLQPVGTFRRRFIIHFRCERYRSTLQIYLVIILVDGIKRM